jgi:hypothetical protein
MTEGRQPFTAEIKTLAKGPSTYDPLENEIGRKKNLNGSLVLDEEKDSSGALKPKIENSPNEGSAKLVAT